MALVKNFFNLQKSSGETKTILLVSYENYSAINQLSNGKR